MSKYVSHELFVCDCSSVSHQFILSTWNFQDGSPTLELSIKLNIYRPWYERILIAIKYLFKFRSETAFDVVMLSGDDINRLQKSLQEFKTLEEKELIESYKF